MKTVRFTKSALGDLKRHGNVAARIINAIDAYAAGDGAHANNVIQLAGSLASRMRVGDFRAIFEETATDITVTRVAPRGSAYD
jgi:mRNA interferase RelE/StbE